MGIILFLLVGVNNLVRWGVCDIEIVINLGIIVFWKVLGIDSKIIGKFGNSLLRWWVNS